MPLIGVTGIELSPQLHLHFVPKSLLGCLCCCASDHPSRHDLDTQYYIDNKLQARRWTDKHGCQGVSATHARLKLITVRALLPFTSQPFEEAEQAFSHADIEWERPRAIFRSDLNRLDLAIERVKHEIMNHPI